MLRFVFKNSLLYTFASQVPMFANLALYPIISEFLTPFDYYVYGTTMGYIGMLSMFADLGMTALFQNSFFKNNRFFKVYWNHYFGFLLIYRVFYGALIVLSLWLIFRTSEIPTDQLTTVLLLVATPIITFDLARGIGMRLMQFKNRHRVVHVSSFIAGVIAVITSYITIYEMRLGYLGFFISNFVSFMFQGIYFAVILFGVEGIRPVFKLRTRRVKKWLRFSAPLIPHKFSTYLLSSSDRVVLDQYTPSIVSASGVGLYNVAYNFASYFNHFSTQVNTVVTPIYFSLFQAKRKDAHQLIRSLTYLWLGFNYTIACLAGLWSKEVFAVMFLNNETGLKDAYVYVIFLFMAFCYRPLYTASVDFIIYHEKTTSLLKITSLGGVLNVILNIALVPWFGIEAAVFSTFLCYMYMGISGHLFPDTRKYIPLPYYTIPIFLVLIASGFGLQYAVEWELVPKIILTVVFLCVVILTALGKGRKLVREVRTISEI